MIKYQRRKNCSFIWRPAVYWVIYGNYSLMGKGTFCRIEQCTKSRFTNWTEEVDTSFVIVEVITD